MIYTYELGVQLGQIENSPYYFIDRVITVHAANLDEAKDKWAELVSYGINSDMKKWNPVDKTYDELPIKVIRSNDPALLMNDYRDYDINMAMLELLSGVRTSAL
jgi:hypothetical protein